MPVRQRETEFCSGQPAQASSLLSFSLVSTHATHTPSQTPHHSRVAVSGNYSAYRAILRRFWGKEWKAIYLFTLPDTDYWGPLDFWCLQGQSVNCDKMGCTDSIARILGKSLGEWSLGLEATVKKRVFIEDWFKCLSESIFFGKSDSKRIGFPANHILS